MSATSVLQLLGSSPMPAPGIPVDVAMRIYISHSSPPLRGFRSSSYEDLRARNRANQNQNQNRRYKPLRPCLSPQTQRDHHAPAPAPCLGVWKPPQTKDKKRVVFADSKGMSLTAIHVFSRCDEDVMAAAAAGLADLQFDLADLDGRRTADPKVGVSSVVRSLALDFGQPASDYLDFRRRLMANGVCLESCSLQERSLTGTVKVRNLSFEKAVAVRITFDSWRSHRDVGCSYMNNVYGSQDVDAFAFVLELPGYTPPQNRVEFCVCFRNRDGTHWDNNDGRNYRLKHVGWDGADLQVLAPSVGEEGKKTTTERKSGVKLLEVTELDQFGSPRTSSGHFPGGWQSWGHIENSAPYW